MNAIVRGVLLDIEGTTSAVAYVYDVMFPYARQHLASYIADHWNEPELQPIKSLIASEAADSAAASSAKLLAEAAWRLMDGDAKTTGLKQLQGLVWEAGFRDGHLRAHVYDDVEPCLRAWKLAGHQRRIYSSGSIHAQQLFFGHSDCGNLLPLVDGHYDTTIGGKRLATSYTAIATDWGLASGDILFLSDIVAELQAASEAGLQVALVSRPGNAPVEPGHGFPEIKSLAELQLALPR
jgi:enolase-phosphatase E1